MELYEQTKIYPQTLYNALGKDVVLNEVRDLLKTKVKNIHWSTEKFVMEVTCQGVNHKGEIKKIAPHVYVRLKVMYN
jgi:adenylate kinase